MAQLGVLYYVVDVRGAIALARTRCPNIGACVPILVATEAPRVNAGSSGQCWRE